MRVSSPNEARQGFIAAALSVPLAVFGAAEVSGFDPAVAVILLLDAMGVL